MINFFPVSSNRLHTATAPDALPVKLPAILFAEISKNEQAERIKKLETDVKNLKEKIGNTAPVTE